MDAFLQDPPRPSNRFRTDRAFRRVLERLLEPDAFHQASGELDAMGERTLEELPALQDRAEGNPPRHVPYDAWGRRVDRVEVDPAWTELVRIGQEAGVVAIPYEGTYGAAGRIVQFALLHLFDPVSATADCPLSMTDAAARVLLVEDPALAERYVPRLTARRDAWTSGQWMTEKEGGSDVGRTATVARPHPDDPGRFSLHGTKWFTSATTADVALALARPEGAEEGSRGLSLYLLELRRPDGTWNGLTVRRLKDKLGTKALPTAELDLDGTEAVMVGGPGRGVARIATMLNVTRVHAAFGGMAEVAHGLDLARDFARRREAFGRPIADLPVHRRWMAGIAASYEAMLVLGFRAAELLGAVENGGGDAALARLTFPLTKLALARQSVWATSELLEAFGGAGYLEDTGLPRLLRDAHVQAIWEGTTSVLALDVLRALRKDGSGEAFLGDLEERVRRSDHPLLADPGRRVLAALGELRPLVAEPEEGGARRMAWGMARAAEAALVVEQAAWSLDKHGDERSATAAAIFTAEPLVSPEADLDDDRLGDLALEDSSG
ncbi:MAG: acyl-CoA dehydrogenase family protein [Actinobacteria bacterium]|nr:acyl-CoA dehydrogenase family protein [Actinomycetota bacterium]